MTKNESISPVAEGNKIKESKINEIDKRILDSKERMKEITVKRDEIQRKGKESRLNEDKDLNKEYDDLNKEIKDLSNEKEKITIKEGIEKVSNSIIEKDGKDDDPEVIRLYEDLKKLTEQLVIIEADEIEASIGSTSGVEPNNKIFADAIEKIEKVKKKFILGGDYAKIESGVLARPEDIKNIISTFKNYIKDNQKNSKLEEQLKIREAGIRSLEQKQKDMTKFLKENSEDNFNVMIGQENKISNFLKKEDDFKIIKIVRDKIHQLNVRDNKDYFSDEQVIEKVVNDSREEIAAREKELKSEKLKPETKPKETKPEETKPEETKPINTANNKYSGNKKNIFDFFNKLFKKKTKKNKYLGPK